MGGSHGGGFPIGDDRDTFVTRSRTGTDSSASFVRVLNRIRRRIDRRHVDRAGRHRDFTGG